MHTVQQMNPTLHARAMRKQAELWERIFDVLSGDWERGWSRSWRVEPVISLAEVMDDLEYGRA